MKICVSANHISYPQGGGHMWVFLNWCLGLKEIGCDVIWMEGIDGKPKGDWLEQLSGLQTRLKPYGLADSVALWTLDGGRLPPEIENKCMDVEEAADADLLINLHYQTPADVVDHFRRSALIDIDPGLLQTWVSGDYNFSVPPHTHYFTIGETVGRPEAKFPDLGVHWHYIPPPVCLEWWRPARSTDHAPFTTISHWGSRDWLKQGDRLVSNEKRAGFLPFLDLPRYTTQILELALPSTKNDPPEWKMLEDKGWRVRDSYSVSSTPWDYQNYIHTSMGEFSCVKPSCVWFQNAWISDRTLCYLANGKPAVIQHTGQSRILPDAAGMFRFRTLQEAASSLETVAADYERQCRLARELAEEFFDAKKVVKRVLERALS